MRHFSLSNASRRDVLRTGVAAAVGVALAGRLRAADTSNKLPLITKAVPATGEKLPVVGVGTNNYNVTTQDEIASRREVLRQLSEVGGKVVDTAPLYGASEALIGDLVAGLGNRAKLFLATKVMAPNGVEQGIGSMEESLRRLRTPRIDLMQVHNLSGTDALMPVLQDWKKAGKVRYIGITTSSPAQHAQMLESMRRYPLDFIQVDYSLGNRLAAQEILPLAQEKKIGVMLNVPFGGRRGDNLFPQVGNRPLPAWAADIDVTSWGQFFLKYVLGHPAVTCAIPGTTQPKHLEDNQGAARGRLPDAAMRKRMEEFWDAKGA